MHWSITIDHVLSTRSNSRSIDSSKDRHSLHINDGLYSAQEHTQSNKHLMDKKFWTFKLSQKLVFVCKVCMIYFIVTDFEVLSKHFACISQHKVLVIHEIIA